MVGFSTRHFEVLASPAASLSIRSRVLWVRACGHIGSGAEYLFRTVSKLEENGIHDRNLWQLQKLVATEIAKIYHGAIREGQAKWDR